MFSKIRCDASAAIKEMIMELKSVSHSQINCMFVQRLRSDNFGEFLSKPLKRLLMHKGITHELEPHICCNTT